jgi:hypothetical protein
MSSGSCPKISNRPLGNVGEYRYNSSYSQLWHCLAIDNFDAAVILPPEE